MTSAIVIGGGICGLASAAAALRHFDSVTVIERDDLTGSRIADEPDPVQTEKRRKGVQQFLQPHVLLAGGARALDRLVPGFLAELSARGALSYDAGHGFRCFDFGGGLGAGTGCARPAGLTIYAASRRLISETLQDLFVAQGGSNLTLMDRTMVAGWAYEGRTVTGVVLDSGATLSADLVIVADGRRTQMPYWLKEMGVELPEPLKVDCKLTYVSRWMKLPPDFDPNNEFYSSVVNGRPQISRGGMAMAIEGGAAQFVLTGFGGTEAAPTEHLGWLEYAASLPDPIIYNLAKRCTPAGPITKFASVPNIHRRYHEVNLPEGVVVLGDAAMALSPAYGQGMTVAAQAAETLGTWLGSVQGGAAAARDTKNTKIFQLKLNKQIDGAWKAACAEDMSWEGTEVRGPVPVPPGGLRARYLAAVMAAAKADPMVWARVLEVAQLEAPASALFSPAVAVRVARAALFGERGSKTVQAAA